MQNLRSTLQLGKNWSKQKLLSKEFKREHSFVLNPEFEIYPSILPKLIKTNAFKNAFIYVKSFIGNHHLSRIQNLRASLHFGQN